MNFFSTFLNQGECRMQLKHMQVLDGTLPLLYTLDFRFPSTPSESPTIVVGMHDSALAWFLRHIPRMASPSATGPRTGKGISSEFFADIKAPWGYGGCISPLVEKKGNLNYFDLKIPRVEYIVGPCSSCNSSGMASDHDSDCIHCLGDGKEKELRWADLVKLSATIHRLHWVSQTADETLLGSIQGKEKQTLTFFYSFDEDRPLLCAEVSPLFADYLRVRSGQRLHGVAKAMEKTYLHMMPSFAAYGSDQFEAHIGNNGQLFLKVGGSEMFVDGSDDGLSDKSKGMRAYTHHARNFHHLITHLAGLAMLTKQVESNRELYPADSKEEAA